MVEPFEGTFQTETRKKHFQSTSGRITSCNFGYILKIGAVRTVELEVL
jgi:hypothetical protein